MRIITSRLIVALLAALNITAGAGAAEVLYKDDFQSYGTQKNPSGWVDNAIGKPAPAADGLYKTWPDPTEGSKGTNVVFGTKQSSGKPEGTNPRIGTFSTLTTHTFSAAGRFEFRGRFVRTTADARVGVTFLSSYPTSDRYYLLGLWSQPGADRLTMQLFGFPARPLTGAIDSGFTPEPGKWVRFLVRVDDINGETRIKARFWADGTPEPETFSVEAIDSSTERMTTGAIGLWGAVRGDAYIDEILAKSPVDFNAPAVAFYESGSTLADGAIFNRTVTPEIRAIDDVDPAPRVAATLDGAPYVSGTPVATEGVHTIFVTATDSAGNAATGQVSFTIDLTPPLLTIALPEQNAILPAPRIAITGMTDDAISIRARRIDATIDPLTKEFAIADVQLLEGVNEIVVVAVDRAGNTASQTLLVTLDTRAPELLVATPAAGACLDAVAVDVTGVVNDTRVQAVRVRAAGAVHDAALAPNGQWSVRVPTPVEGDLTLAIEAVDVLGHTAVVSRSIRIDRSAPVIDITESGVPFTATHVNRPLSIFVRVTDAPQSAKMLPSVTTTLDGAAYALGTPIESEGAHILRVVARDCAGHEAAKTLDFTIDRTPPVFEALDPANDARVGTLPSSLHGRVSADATRVESGSVSATPASDGTFILPLTFAEGENALELRATDRAGNVGTLAYRLIVKSGAPPVSILEDGRPIPDGAILNRALALRVESSESGATIVATLDGAPFTSGSSISTDGDHHLRATATDDLGNSGTAEARFTIDRTAPAVTIATPANGTTIDADRVDVTGSQTDAAEIIVNGRTATISGSSFSAAGIPLDLGTNAIVANAVDRAGNSARHAIDVERAGTGPAIVLAAPVDGSRTNRGTTVVSGRVADRAAVANVTLASASQAPIAIPVDTSGAFRHDAFTLAEGENSITAAAVGTNGKSVAASARVVADFTPPRVELRAGDLPLADGARFSEAIALALDATDTAGSVTSEMTVDGIPVAQPHIVAAAGGHIVTALARDTAGNETRVERTFFIGSGGAAAGCSIEGLAPAEGSVIFARSTRVVGRTSAFGITVNGVATDVVGGSFCATVELPSEGDNPIVIRCVDASGATAGDPVTLTLQRQTGDPSVAIDASLVDGSLTSVAALNVTGTHSGADVVEVNGVTATLGSGGTWRAANVVLTPGVNIITARATSAAQRTATASRRVILVEGPPAIAITSPLDGGATGALSVDLSGTWLHLDPATLVVTVSPAPSNPDSGARIVVQGGDTSGSFTIRGIAVPRGESAVTIVARNAAGDSATASIRVRSLAESPSIDIATPRDNLRLTAEALSVTGRIVAGEGSVVDVNGARATLDAAGNFVATVAVAASSTGWTPVVARVTQPDGATAVDIVRVQRLAEPMKLVASVPESGATGIEPASAIMLVFSAPIDRATANAVTLRSVGGSPVNGLVRIDRDVVTLAPAALLAGGDYVVDLGAALRDVFGNALATPVAIPFHVLAGAPASAPQLDPITAACGAPIKVAGTAIAGARVRLEVDGMPRESATDASGRFSFDLPPAGDSAYHLLRVRILGVDGSLSASADACVRTDCAGPQVTDAAFDRNVNVLTVRFSRPVDPSTVTFTAGALALTTSDGRSVTGNVTGSGLDFVVTPAEDLRAATFTLTAGTAVRDLDGRPLAVAFTRTFAVDGGDVPADGTGFIAGEIFSATTGRPLTGATITVSVPLGAFSDPNRLVAASRLSTNAARDLESLAVTAVTDARGRYVVRVPEGAHTIEARAAGHSTVWRQVIVAAGAGIVPIDIRLTADGPTATAVSGPPVTLSHGRETSVTRAARLDIPAGAVPAGTAVTLTSVGSQALAGLLPLGWSPLASADVRTEGSGLSGSLSFTVNAAAIAAAAQTLTAVRYDSARDEWIVEVPVVAITGAGEASFPIADAASWALVYRDQATGLRAPPSPVAGSALAGVADPCGEGTCAELAGRPLRLDPPVVLPTERSVATVEVEGAVVAGTPAYASGTAVQAYIDEELNLADGTKLIDPPFATDLILYRTLDGATSVADFHLQPSARAGEVTLNVGYDHIRLHPYPGRLDRGTLVGAEGGRITGDDGVTIEVPAGAATEALHVRAASLPSSDLAELHIEGFEILGGFSLQLARAEAIEGAAAPELVKPARAIVTPSQPVAAADQLILVELLDDTPYGMVPRLATRCLPLDGSARVTTGTVDRAVLPVDGVVRDGRYVLLRALSPIAFAKGLVTRSGVHLAAWAPLSASDATPRHRGTGDVVRPSAVFVLPVPAAPAGAFRVVPRHASFGEAEAYVHPSAPARDEVVDLATLPIAPRRLSLLSIAPADGATEVLIGTTVTANFDATLDRASLANALVVHDLSNGQPVPGAIADGAGASITWTPALPLTANRRYSVTLAPSIRSAAGALFGTTHVTTFATISRATSNEVNRKLIRITIPTSEGISYVIGAPGAPGEPGALPTGWTALAVRKGRDFIVKPSATAATNGSFTITLGTDPADVVSIRDSIDLHVTDNFGFLRDIIALTPFVAADGKSFIAPPDRESRFTSVDGVTVIVPAGAFEDFTAVALEPASAESFAAVPSFAQELRFVNAVQLSFEGVAKKRLQLEFPVGTADTNIGPYVVAELFESRRGPRVAIADSLRIENDRFTTRTDDASASAGSRLASNAIVVRNEAKSIMPGVKRPGTYTVVGFTTDVVWTVLERLEASFELLLDSFLSIGVPSAYLVESDGRAVVPVRLGAEFTITGVDVEGFDRFTIRRTASNDPGAIIVIDDPGIDQKGPYPVFATPNRVEIFTVAEDLSVPGGRLTLERGTLHGRFAPTRELRPGTTVRAFNSSRGTLSSEIRLDAEGEVELSLQETKLQDRVVLWYGATETDPATSISVVFSEPVSRPAADAPGYSDDTITSYFRERIRIDRVNGNERIDVTNEMRFGIDSSDRRISILPRSSLVRGTTYRITLKPSITDKAGKQLLSVIAPGATSYGGREVSLEMRVAGPQGVIGEFDVLPSPTHPSASIRDIARGKSLVFVSAMEGGLVAYDLNDPSLLAPSAESKPQPVAFVPGNWSDEDGRPMTVGLDQHWAVATDNHGRVFATGFFSNLGVLRSYREEDFRAAATTDMCAEQPDAPAHALCRHVGAAFLSWRPGYASAFPLGSDIISDRPEAYVRKLQIVADDVQTEALLREAFKSGYGAVVARAFSNGAEQLHLSVPFDRTNPYQIQRITVENSTRRQSWSADARPDTAADFDRIIAMPGDMLRIIRNSQTFGVVTLFGYGVGVYDLNAIESNDAARNTAGYEPLREQVALTDGTANGLCIAAPEEAAIKSVSLSPDALLQQTDYRTLTAFTLEVRRGILDLSLTLPKEAQTSPLCVRRSTGLELFDPATGKSPHPRLNAIVQKYVENGLPINARFQSIAPFTWSISAAENTLGERGTPRGSDARRDYALVPAGDLGLLVVETFSRPSHPLVTPGVLSAGNLADVVWVPSGAVAVRVIQSEALALVIDGDGRLLLVDISRIDERMRPDGGTFGNSILFPTATAAISDGLIAGRIGRDDPRIVWKSEPGLVTGTLPPIYDPISGVAFLGQLLTKTMAVASLVDPRLQILGQDSTGRLVPIDAIAPLGMAAAPGATPAFRVGMQLPRSAERALGGRLNVAIESERVAGALAGFTPPHWPLAHLRLTAGESTEEGSRQRAITLSSDLTDDLTPEESAALIALQDDQTTAGRLLSPWIVAVADPRASIRYAPLTSLGDEGCVNCERPANLAGRSENEGVFELWSSSLVRVRPECPTATPCANPLAGTPYAQLAASGRLQARIASAAGDTVRPRGTEVAAVLPPVADGAFQDTIYLHSGELETSDVDHMAGGRASAVVAVGRTYRSRTIGWSPFGLGWDSSIFRRLRRMANGDVEFRDGSGEVWTFRWSGGSYKSPPGLFLKLERSAEGWTLLDINNRLQRFDERGRIVFESDEFYVPGDEPKGNTIQYFYDASGRLSRIVDPVGRATKLAYWDSCTGVEGCYTGLVREIEDWRGRRVNYEYDTQMRLARVVLPATDVAAGVPAVYRLAGDRRPRIEYRYAAVAEPPSAGQPSPEWSTYLKSAGNLVAKREPAEVAKGVSGKDRVRYQYYAGAEAGQDDRVVAQASPCAGYTTVCTEATATLEYSGDSVRTVDALGQLRSHDLVRGPDGRMHLQRLRVHDVAYYEAGAVLPPFASVDLTSSVTDLTTSIDAFNAHGQPQSIDAPGVGAIDFAFETVRNFATRLKSIGVPREQIVTLFGYDVSPLAFGAMGTIGKVVGEVLKSDGSPVTATRDAQTPHRDRRLTVTADDEVVSRQIYSVDGQLVDDRLTDITSSEPKRTTEYDYFDAKQPPIARGRLSAVDQGRGSIVSRYEYAATATGGEVVRATDTSTGAVNESESDALGRTIREETRDASGAVLVRVILAYDASGQIVYAARKQGDDTVTETWTYDPSGRAIEHRLDNAIVDGVRSTVETRSRFDLTPTGMVETSVGPFVAGRESDAAQSVVVRDRIGRPVEMRQAGADGSLVRRRTLYDKGGRVSYESDGLNAVITRYDGLGRPVGSVDSAAVQTQQTWTAWNEPDQQETLAKPDSVGERSVIARSRNKYSKNGSLDRTNVQIDLSGQSLSSWTRNYGGSYSVAKQGHAASVDDDPSDMGLNPMRGETTTLDLAGRVTVSRSGAMGVGQTLITDTNTFAETRVGGYRGTTPTLVHQAEPRAGATYTAIQQHDVLGRVTRQQIAGGEPAEYVYDEAGNTLRVDAPGFPPASATWDSRGLLLDETRPDGSVIARKYNARGDLTEYRDETGRVTLYSYDGLGRLARTAYPDGTTEEARYLPDSGAVHATRDRAGVWIVNEYDVQGRLAALRHGGTGAAPDDGGAEFVRYTYDAGSRIARVANRDSAIEYEDFDFVGRARLTRFIRFQDHSGLSTALVELDRHAMEHRYDVFGQITAFRMPAAGVPATVASVPPNGVVTDGWLGWIEQSWDAGGNLVAQRSMEPDGTLLSSAESRGVGRLQKRVTNVAGGVPLSTFYTYADGPTTGGVVDESGGVPPPYDGTLAGITVWANAIPIAGSEVARDAARRITRSDAMGLVGRSSLFAYDAAGRLTGDAVAARDALESPGLAHENLYTPAEFRQARATRTALSEEQVTRLEAVGEASLVPRGWTATENAAHAIETRTVGTTEFDYVNEGGRRTSDGVWSAEYDELGRLTARTRTTGEARRIEYLYDPNDRLVARIAKQPAGEAAWALETRTTVLTRDGLPAETTFVWDPVTDRLLAIFEAGQSIGATDPNAGLLKQYLHGDQSYDDPTHVYVRNVAPGAPVVLQYRTVVDPLAGGSVTAVVDPTGHLVERILYADAYGDAPQYLHGAVVDKISVHAEKDGTGAIAKIVFRARLSERIDPASLPAGARLEALRGDGSTTPAPAAVTPELFENTTVQWTLTGAQWAAFVTDATSIRLSITSDLRTPAWGNQGPMPAPSWAQTLFGVESTPTQPVIWTEPLGSLELFIAAVPSRDTRSNSLYAIPHLYLAASEQTHSQLLIGYKAAPFVEPVDCVVYVRARWYDAATGAWLATDPIGYEDASDLYSYCAANPVGCADPTGMFRWDPSAWGHGIDFAGEAMKLWVYDHSSAASSGIHLIDDSNQLQSDFAAAMLGTGIDFLTTIPSGLLTIGERTGLAVFEGDWDDHPLRSYLGLLVAGNLDYITTGSYALGFAAIGEGAAAGVTNRLVIPAISDFSTTPALPNVTEKLSRYHELPVIENVMLRASRRAVNRALASGARGSEAGFLAENMVETYAYQMQLRLMAFGSPYRITTQAAGDLATGERVLARTVSSFRGSRTRGAKILDYGFYLSRDASANSARILSGADFTVSLRKAISAGVPTEYAPAFPGARLFGVNPVRIYGP